MARRNAEDWAKLLHDFAKAHESTKIKPQEWVDSKLEEGAWGSAKRHITLKRAKVLIEANFKVKKPKKSAKKSAKTTTKSTAKSANSKKAQNNSANSANTQPTKNTGKTSKATPGIASKPGTKTVTKDQKSQSKAIEKCEKAGSPKRSHGAIPENEPEKCEKSAREVIEYDPDIHCGARNRLGARCRKQAGWGTSHFGEGRCRVHGGLAGPLSGNKNATIHGIYSQYLDDDEQDLFDNPEAGGLDLTPEIAMTRIELKRAYELAAMQRDLMDGPKGRFGFEESSVERHSFDADGKPVTETVSVSTPLADRIRELDSHEDGISGEGLKDIRKYVVRDYTEIANRLMARLLNLIRQQHQSDGHIPRAEVLEFTDHYLLEYEAGNITAKEVALSLARVGVDVPKIIEIAMRSEIDNAGGAGDGEGANEEELDRLVAEARTKDTARSEKNMAGRAEIIEQMMRGEDIGTDEEDAN